MTVTVRISGDGLSFSQEVSSNEAVQLLKVGLEGETTDGDGMNVSLRNEHMDFEKDVPSTTGMRMMQLVVGSEETDEAKKGIDIAEIESLVEDMK